MSADPREIPDAHVIPELSYDETAELAYFGARLLHERMIEPLRAARIPLRVRNIFRPHAPGTVIRDHTRTGRTSVKAVASTLGLICHCNQRSPLHPIAALVDDALFDLTGARADVLITLQSSSQSLAAFVIPLSAGPDALHSLQDRVTDMLEAQGLTHWSVGHVAVITAVGAGIGDDAPTIGQINARLHGIPILAMRGGRGVCSYSVLVDPAHIESALTQIHDLIASGTQG
jgi:aspartate kinase